jgi:hypothetical protein
VWTALFVATCKYPAPSLQKAEPAWIICNRPTDDMGFYTEPTFYQKTILSDLQGAWQCLREEVAGDVPDAAAECLDAVSELMDETFEALSKGEIV